jgi:nitroreductase
MEGEMIDTPKLTEFLKTRTSHRKYQPDPIPEATIRRLIDCARYAPSGHNLQPWRFVAVADREQIQAMGEAVDAQYSRIIADVPEDVRKKYEAYRFYVTHFKDAPLVFVVLATKSTYITTDLATEYGIDLPPVAHVDMDLLGVGAVVQNLLLAAHAEGLGACCMTDPITYAQQQLEALLPVPEGFHIVTLVPMGKPTKTRHGPPKKDVEELLVIQGGEKEKD